MFSVHPACMSGYESSFAMSLSPSPTIVTMLLFFFLFLLFPGISQGNALSETSAARDLEHISIREELEGGGLDDMTDYSDFRLSPKYPLLLATAGEPVESGDILSMNSPITDPFSLGFGTADNINESPDMLDNPLFPSDLKPGDLLAFHDGDLPDEGWGDCDFPKMPACCEHTILGVTCIWYTWFGSICPEHPADISPPRTPAERARYRAVCCDQVIEEVGIGCVPVHGRVEPGMEEEESMGDDADDFFPVLTDFNSIKFTPAPGECKSNYRRDSQTPTQCLPQEP